MADATFDSPQPQPARDQGEAQRPPVDPEDPATWGDGYCYAPDEVQMAMREMVMTYEVEQIVARLEQIRQVLRNREMYAGRQVIYWSASENRYRVPTAEELGLSEEEYADVELTTNLFRPFVKIVMAELSQAPPRTQFSPEHPKVLADVRLAKDATNITQYINRENRIDEKLAYEVWLLCCDGSFAEYWRFVRDEKFGIEDYEVTVGQKEVELAPNRAICPRCGAVTPTESPEAAPPVCTDPACGAPMGPAMFKPRDTVMQDVKEPRQRPAGREVCDIVGMLELVIPAYEKDENELGFLTWCREVHKSKLMAIFPHAADAIQGGAGAGTATATNERIARLSLVSGWQRSMDGQPSLTTFRETWFRPWTYEMLRQNYSGMREKFLQWFPNGFRVAFAGDTYCGSWPDKLQDHWTICHAFPQDGQHRGAIGTDAVSSQRKYNKCDSIELETYERGLPFQVADTDVWDVNALQGRTEAAAVYGAQGRGNKTVSNSIWTSPTLPANPQIPAYKRDLRTEIMQHQFQAFSAMYGGGGTGGNDTAHGIAIERNAAKGGLGLVYRAIKNFRARADLKNIQLFLDNRTQDVEIAVAGPGSEWDAVSISLADLKEGSVQVEINEDESFPMSLNEQNDRIATLVNNANPAILSLFADPVNAEEMVSGLGLSERIRIPGADAREKAFDIIGELVKGAPIQPQAPMPMAMPPGMTPPGMPPAPPMPQPPPEPSIQPDPVLDDLVVFAQTGKEWSATAAGRKAQLETPDGYANVRAWVQKCLMLSAPPPMPMIPPPNGTGGPPKQLPQPPEQNPGGPMPPVGPM